MITAQTQLYGLIGHPVRQSLSPAMYNELFHRFGMDARYLAFDVHPSRSQRVGDAIQTLGLVGVNLTVPFKEQILPQLDHMTQAAREAGAVNVVISVDGWLTGYNTDGEGFVRNLLELGFDEFSSLSVVILGAGGTARAVAAALIDREVAQVVLLNRTLIRAQKAIESLSDIGGATLLKSGRLDPAGFQQHARNAQVVVNCTAGAAAEMVGRFDPGCLAAGAIWVDVNYWMEEPPLQSLCEHLGVAFHTGHSMLMHQGALAFELFTGHPVRAAEIRDFMPSTVQAC